MDTQIQMGRLAWVYAIKDQNLASVFTTQSQISFCHHVFDPKNPSLPHCPSFAMQYTDDVALNCTLETYRIALANITPNKFNLKSCHLVVT